MNRWLADGWSEKEGPKIQSEIEGRSRAAALCPVGWQAVDQKAAVREKTTAPSAPSVSLPRLTGTSVFT